MTNLFTTVAQIIVHTPIWVWFILLFLVWRGLGSTISRDVGLARLLLMPGALLILTLWSVLGSGISTAIVVGLLIGALAGIATGLVLERRNPATGLGNGRIKVPGEWTTLVVILVVFATRYIRIVAGIMAPAVATSTPFLIVMGVFSAFNTAMLLTRTVLRIRVLLAPTPLMA